MVGLKKRKEKKRKRAHRVATCLRKHRHKTEDEALNSIKEHNKAGRTYFMRFYLCEYCEGYHLTKERHYEIR